MKYPLFQQILPSCFSATLKPRLNERNTVGPNNSQLCWMSDLLRPFAHPVACCWHFLEYVGQVTLGDVLSQQLPTFLLLRDRDRVDSLAQLFLHCLGQTHVLHMVYKVLWVVSFSRYTADPNIVGVTII